MSIYLRPYRSEDTPAVLEIWNEVIEEGGSIPFVEPIDRGVSGDDSGRCGKCRRC